MKGILVVDDDEDIRETVSLVLTEAGYAVTQAVDGQDALAKLEAMPEGEPGLVLLDIVMPRMSGNEVLATLAQTKRLPALLVVVISATPRSAVVAGARKIVPKPVSIQALLDVVEEMCGAA